MSQRSHCSSVTALLLTTVALLALLSIPAVNGQPAATPRIISSFNVSSQVVEGQGVSQEMLHRATDAAGNDIVIFVGAGEVIAYSNWTANAGAILWQVQIGAPYGGAIVDAKTNILFFITPSSGAYGQNYIQGLNCSNGNWRFVSDHSAWHAKLQVVDDSRSGKRLLVGSDANGIYLWDLLGDFNWRVIPCLKTLGFCVPKATTDLYVVITEGISSSGGTLGFKVFNGSVFQPTEPIYSSGLVPGINTTWDTMKAAVHCTSSFSSSPSSSPLSPKMTMFIAGNPTTFSGNDFNNVVMHQYQLDGSGFLLVKNTTVQYNGALFGSNLDAGRPLSLNAFVTSPVSFDTQFIHLNVVQSNGMGGIGGGLVNAINTHDGSVVVRFSFGNTTSPVMPYFFGGEPSNFAYVSTSSSGPTTTYSFALSQGNMESLSTAMLPAVPQWNGQTVAFPLVIPTTSGSGGCLVVTAVQDQVIESPGRKAAVFLTFFQV